MFTHTAQVWKASMPEKENERETKLNQKIKPTISWKRAVFKSN